MKIKVVSDLHVEFYKNPNRLTKLLDLLYPKVEAEDILIIAGDLGVAGSTTTGMNSDYEYMLKYFAKRWNTVILISGNHEFYDRHKSESLEDICNMIDEKCVELGIHYLNNDVIETGGYIFVGATLWSNADKDAYENMNDKLQAILSHKELIKTHKKDVKWIDSTLCKIAKEKSKVKNANLFAEKPVVVITHHVPLKEIMHPKYNDEEYQITNSGYFTDLSELITKHNHLICYWFHGHTHEYGKHKLHDIEFICNPLGYPDEDKESKTLPIKLKIKEAGI